MANGGSQGYRIFVAATSKFMAIEFPSGELRTMKANRPQNIAACEAIAIWACKSARKANPFGAIKALDCHNLGLHALDVRNNSKLTALDCRENLLPDLELTGLDSLEFLYADNNPLASLDLRPCRQLKFLGLVSRHLGYGAPGAGKVSMTDLLGDQSDILIPPGLARGLVNMVNDTRCAVKYIASRRKPLSPEEAKIREIAYALKESKPGAIEVAAPAMASLIDAPCWLVPIPASDCSLDANLALARAIAQLVPGARVRIAVERSHPVESSTVRRRKGQGGLHPDEHHFVKSSAPLNPMPVFFIDNVITTGSTVMAARAALGWGTGLAYADASPLIKRPRTDQIVTEGWAIQNP